jgi:Flp pilus assembly pilin Flp
MIPQSRNYWWTLWLLSLLVPGEIWRALKGRFNSGWATSIREESGSTMVEYGLLICCISLAVLVLLQQVGSAINQIYLYIVDTLASVH